MTTYDELTPDALRLLEDLSELDIVQLCADRGATIEQLKGELATLHEGEEPYEDDRLVPTPAQWLWKWNHAKPEDKLAVAHDIRSISDRLDRVEALARDWYDAPPLLPGQALAELRNALSDEPEPVTVCVVRAGEHLIRITGDRAPTSDECEAIGALLDAHQAAREDQQPAGDWVTWLTGMINRARTEVPATLCGASHPRPPADPGPLRELAARALTGDLRFATGGILSAAPTVRRDSRADDPAYDGITGYRTWAEVEADPPQFTGLPRATHTKPQGLTMKLPGGGYAPKNDVKPGTPPSEPAGASSANTNPRPVLCACGKPCDHEEQS